MTESFKQLLALYESGELAGEKLTLFLQLLEQEENQQALAQAIDAKVTDAGFLMAEDVLLTNQAVERLRTAINRNAIPDTIPLLPIPRKRRKTGRWLTAAAAIIVLAVSGYWLSLQYQEKGELAITTPIPDVKAPESNRATIMLADGRTVYLDSVGSGALAEQGNMKLVKLADGQIAYQAGTADVVLEIQYNTLVNPRGSKVIDMTLADGSRVWLNAGTSITYPVAFVGADRTVSVKGEAYFEVAPDKTKPFLVNTGDAFVKVLGTHFNVMNYSGEPSIQTTLLEGSVEMVAGDKTLILKPGQQSNLKQDGGLTLTNNVDVELVTAWKNGLQSFRHTDLKTLMRQVERWYDVDVVYEAVVPASLSFTGEGISRKVSLRELLQVLENKELKFEIDANGRKVTVKKIIR